MFKYRLKIDLVLCKTVLWKVDVKLSGNPINFKYLGKLMGIDPRAPTIMGITNTFCDQILENLPLGTRKNCGKTQLKIWAFFKLIFCTFG